jgi:hypothetical protein
MKTEKAAQAAIPEKQGKDSHFLSQYKEVYELFRQSPKSRMQVHLMTGYLESNICRYVGAMRKARLIQVFGVRKCPYTKRLVEYLTTDKVLFDKQNNSQLNLFDNGI